jgi:hypothetical protein
MDISVVIVQVDPLDLNKIVIVGKMLSIIKKGHSSSILVKGKLNLSSQLRILSK